MQSTSWSVRILSLLALFLCLFLVSVDSTIAAPKKPKAHASVRKRKVKRHTESKSRPVASSPKASKASGRRDILSRNEIRDVEQKLSDLGYWTGPIDGKPDEASRHALIAFQKVTGRPRTGKFVRVERSALMRSTRPEPIEAGASHIEIDLRRQVLFMVDDQGVVTKILPVSSGSGKEFFAEGFLRTAVTPPGRFNIQGKIAGWKKSALGRLYYPNYIIGGIAIHGYQSVPTKPASHGCIRIPMFAAQTFSRTTPTGMIVLVYDGKPASPVLASEGEPKK